MVFTETIIPAGRILYKGYEVIDCQTLLRDTRTFFLTETLSTASAYGKPCMYKTKKRLRLFDLTHENITLLLKSGYPLNPETVILLKIVTGTGLKIGEQKEGIKMFAGSANAKNLGVKTVNTRKGQRLSFRNIDKIVFQSLAREFLVPEKYDGYYAPKRKSVFHEGQFHSEIMINNAYQSIERVQGGSLPVASQRTLKWAIPRIFLEYCKRNKYLVKPNRNFVFFLTGGMAVRLYLSSRKGVSLEKKVRRTSDFDFSFAVPRPIKTQKSLAQRIIAMRNLMVTHLSNFIKFLNSQYKGAGARLHVTTRVTEPDLRPRLQIPGTKRRIYQVFSWQVILANKEVVDLADSALVLYPGISRQQIHEAFSYKLGLPLQKLRYQLKDELAIVSGSLLYKGQIAKRNPIHGQQRSKGQKNLARISALTKIVKRDPEKYLDLVNTATKANSLMTKIRKSNSRAAKKSARSVEILLKKIR